MAVMTDVMAVTRGGAAEFVLAPAVIREYTNTSSWTDIVNTFYMYPAKCYSLCKAVIAIPVAVVLRAWRPRAE